MSQSLSRVWLHLVFSTKQHKRYLQSESFRDEMFKMLAYHVKETGCQSASVGGFVDHVHLLVGLTRTITIAHLVERVKSKTSGWAKKSSTGVSTFQWQSGYGVFSVSESLVGKVVDYIQNQAEHHATVSFQGEYRALCRKHGIEIDERYVWD